MDDFKVVYTILSTLEKALDIPEFDTSLISPEVLGISKVRWERYMEMLTDCKYVKGVVVQHYITGQTVMNIRDIRITLKGLEYLHENSTMQRMYKAAKGIVDLIP